MVLLLRVNPSALVPAQTDGTIGFKLSSAYYFRELRCCPFHAQWSSALGLRGFQNSEGVKFSGKCQDAGELHTVWTPLAGALLELIVEPCLFLLPPLVPKSSFIEKGHPPTACPIQDPPTQSFLTLSMSVPVQSYVSEGPRSAWPANFSPSSPFLQWWTHTKNIKVLICSSSGVTANSSSLTRPLSDPSQNKNLSTVTLTAGQ